MGILDLLFPISCLNCKKSGRYFCNDCLKKVQVLNKFDPISKTFSVFRYEGIIRKGITKIKYNFAFDLSKELAGICIQNLKLPDTISEDVIMVPIPLHKSRRSWRGFNQSEILGKLIAEKLKVRFEKDILIRLEKGQNQVGLAKNERERNIRGKFAVNPEAKLYQNVTYLVFDDVVTTGSTLNEAIKVLKKKNINKVFGLTIAR